MTGVESETTKHWSITFFGIYSICCTLMHSTKNHQI